MWINEILSHTFTDSIYQKQKDLCCWGCGERGTTCALLWECKLVEPRGKQYEGSSKLKIEPVIWSSSPLLGKYPNEIKVRISKSYLHFHVQWNIIYSSQDTKTAWMSINGWMDHEDYS